MSMETDRLINEFVADGGDFRDWRPGWDLALTDTIPTLLKIAKQVALTYRAVPTRS